LQVYKRQQIQYQQQIAESDALLRDLRSRESDSTEVLLTKDSQIALLRVRLAESDEFLQTKTSQYEQLQNDYSRLLQNSSNDIQSQSFSDFFQIRITQLEQELERNLNENERINNENQQLIEQLKFNEKRLNDEHLQLYEQQQQTKYAKNLINQLEQDMNDYKTKAQRILQTKDKLIIKLKDIVQHRSSTPVNGDQQLETIGTNDDSTLVDVSLVGNPPASSSISANWASVQYEELKSENELFKQELQARELTIHTLRNDLQESELLIQHNDQQYQGQINQLNEQLKDDRSRLTLVDQDYRKLKQESALMKDDFQKQKQIYSGQLIEREREIERLRLQVTSKTINHVNDDELEKRLQTLTESLIHKQTIIETLQTDKSSLTMQLERLEKRLDDYDTITANNSSQKFTKNSPTTSIPIDDNEHYENLRYRMPLLRETPYDVDLTKKVKRAANELDKLGIRFTLFLRRYPAVRLGVLFYAIILHLWTFIVLFTYTPESHSNTNSINLKDKL
jgi:chromosome segregation ATPase